MAVYVSSDDSEKEKLTISSYIECLQQDREQYGDLPVVVSYYDDDYEDVYYTDNIGHFAFRTPVVPVDMGRYRQAEDDDNENREFVIHLAVYPLSKD